ncbi:MAG: UDP-N-acetylmuramate dehydrogenase [Bacilli bacterium]|nr:UDP-N-acetylmuramate dehydrogenase [Bacilli bacterium]
MDFNKIIYDLVELNVGEIFENEPMYKHTTFKVGGPAKIFVKIKSIEAIQKAKKYCKEKNIKHMIVGKGSDLLFSDKEYEGVIFSLEALNKVSINGIEVKVQAGTGLIPLAYQCAKTGLSGFEFAGGIPGTIGGGVFMNAGAYKYCIADIFKEALILNDNQELVTLSKEEMCFDYRTSILQKHPDWILLEATFTMNPKDPQEIMAVLDKRKEKRMATQPWNLPSAGSVFRNPDAKGAWKYIDECGLRGYEIGGAQVSPKHSNFIVNNGYASAMDILDLILLVEKTVFNKFNIELRKEVILVNWEE